jgi:hypothetical protein
MKLYQKRSRGCGSHRGGMHILFLIPIIILVFFFFANGESDFPFWTIIVVIFFFMMMGSGSRTKRSSTKSSSRSAHKHAHTPVEYSDKYIEMEKNNKWQYDQETNYCPNCGKERRAGDIFCSACGYNLQD